MLKEKVIEFIKNNPDSVDMSIFIEESPMSACGTTACFAGHIVLASGIELKKHKTGELIPKLNLSNNEFDEYGEWLEFEIEKGGLKNTSRVPAFARYLWAKEYGNEAAKNLPFYEDDWEFFVGYTDEQMQAADDYGPNAFDKLTSDDLIKFLESI